MEPVKAVAGAAPRGDLTGSRSYGARIHFANRLVQYEQMTLDVFVLQVVALSATAKVC